MNTNIKNIKIQEETHTKLKIYCSTHKLKLNEWVDELLNINLKYGTLISLLNSAPDIKYMIDKYKASTNIDERVKLRKQLTLMLDCNLVCADVFSNKIKEETEQLLKNI